MALMTRVSYVLLCCVNDSYEMFLTILDNLPFCIVSVVFLLICVCLMCNRMNQQQPGNHYYQANKNEKIKQYQLLGSIGKGSFGEVHVGYDLKCKKQVAVKIAKAGDSFNNSFKREVAMLKLTNRSQTSENQHFILQLIDSFIYRGHGIIITEMLERDLRSELTRNRTGLPLSRIRVIAKGILRGLKALHSMNIVHCDLKPENVVFVNKFDAVKIVDYGNCLTIFEGNPGYRQTRPYRAPEVILRMPFSKPVDIWSFACVLCELFCGTPIFFGMDERKTLAYIMQFLGVPPSQYSRRSTVYLRYFNASGYPMFLNDLRFSAFEKRFQYPGALSLLRLLYRSRCPSFINLVTKCLVWYPELRPTAHMCLCDEFFAV